MYMYMYLLLLQHFVEIDVALWRDLTVELVRLKIKSTKPYVCKYKTAADEMT